MMRFTRHCSRGGTHIIGSDGHRSRSLNGRERQKERSDLQI
jgi:hypothetical protein